MRLFNGDKKMKGKNLQKNLKQDLIMKNAIKSMEISKPYVDPVTGTVYWGTDSESRKGKKNA